MEFAFILFLIAILIAVAAAAVVGIAAVLRRGKLHPEGDKVEGGEQLRGDVEHGDRPEHVRVSNEQRTRFVPGR